MLNVPAHGISCKGQVFLHCAMNDGEPHQSSCYTSFENILWSEWD